MNVSLYQAAAALEGSLQRQDVIAENLAAAGIPGFKRSQVGFHSVNAEMFSNALGSVNKTELQYMLPRVTGYINFDQGSLMPSGDNNSLSIDGPGFFSVNSPEGTVYTRNGSFLVNSEGLIQKVLVEQLGGTLHGKPAGQETISDDHLRAGVLLP